MVHHQISLVIFVSTLAVSPSYSQSLNLCPAPTEITHVDNAESSAGVDIKADQMIGIAEASSHFRGNVILTEGQQEIQADEMQYNQQTGQGHATGNTSYATPGYLLSGDTAEFDTHADTTRISNARYQQFSTRMQGRASTIERSGNERTLLYDATLSSCPPGEEDWLLETSELELNHQTQDGTAKHAVLSFKGIPFFYSPWFRFPIGPLRKSGFLTPNFSRSAKSGHILEVPWYWNIHPQADATLTPRHLSERGTQLKSEFRYLAHHGTWQVDAEYLEDSDYGDTRTFGYLKHAGRFGPWQTAIVASDASDKDYFDDLGNSLDISSITHLEQRADLTFYGAGFNSRLRAQSYQTIDESIVSARRPYQRLPQLTFNMDQIGKPGEINYKFNAELVNFERDDRIAGQRMDVNPGLSYPTGGAAWFLEPELGLRHTRYSLDDPNADTTDASNNDLNAERNARIFSVDSGLFFERDAGKHIQTLEPRLYYLYAPKVDQDDIQVFDSGAYNFSFAQLFRNNRFTGKDRIGDADQLSVAVSTRYLEKTTGKENFSASLGQILYFDDREVSLSDGAEPITRERSDIIAEAGLRLGQRWFTSAGLQYDPDTDLNNKGVYQLRYRGLDNSVANFAYRYTRESQAQVDLSFRWTLNPRWSLLARWNHSLLDEQDLETMSGFQYEDCCWMFRAVAREYLIEEGEDTEEILYFQLVLKGLGDLGDEAGSVLERGILGYRQSEPQDSL